MTPLLSLLWSSVGKSVAVTPAPAPPRATSPAGGESESGYLRAGLRLLTSPPGTATAALPLSVEVFCFLRMKLFEVSRFRWLHPQPALSAFSYKTDFSGRLITIKQKRVFL